MLDSHSQRPGYDYHPIVKIILYFYPVNFLSEGCELTFVLIHAFSLFVLKTEMVTNAKINLKPPSFVKKYYGVGVSDRFSEENFAN